VTVCYYSTYVIHAQFGFIMPPPKLAGGEHSAFGSLVRPLSVNTYFLWHDTSVCLLLGGISLTLVAIIHRVSGNCWTGFQGPKSKVKVITRLNALFWQRDRHSTDGRPSVVRPAEAYRSPSRHLITWMCFGGADF